MANITAEMILLMKIVIKLKIIFFFYGHALMQKLIAQNFHAGYSWTGWSGFFLSLYVQANVSHTNLVNVKVLVMNKFINDKQ